MKRSKKRTMSKMTTKDKRTTTTVGWTMEKEDAMTGQEEEDDAD